MRTVTVLGAGSWGTALAVHLGRVGHDVRLWARDRALVDDMAARRANAVYLPDVPLPDSVVVTDTVPIDPLTKPERVTVITVADILAETIHNVFADDSVSAIFGDMNALF